MKLITIASALLVGGAWLSVVPATAEARAACAWPLVASSQKKTVGKRTIRMQGCGKTLRATLTGGKSGDRVRLEISGGGTMSATVNPHKSSAITRPLSRGSHQARACGTPKGGSKFCTSWWPSEGPPTTRP